MPAKMEELVGEFDGEGYRNDTGWIYGWLADGTKISGVCQPGDLVRGIPYRFVGRWSNGNESKKYGRQFQFRAFVQSEPHSRAGVVEYLQRYVDGVGPAIANRLCDVFGVERAVGVLKSDPGRAARQVDRLTANVAIRAAEMLKQQERFQETKIDLLDLFARRGFPHRLVALCCERFGVMAARKIRFDPFCLMTHHLPGCGFLRCDRLYIELGLPPDRIKRQVMAGWHEIHSNSNGSTWVCKSKVAEGIEQRITGNVRAERAIAVGVRAGWLVEREVDGVVWLADAKYAASEKIVLEESLRMIQDSGVSKWLH